MDCVIKNTHWMQEVIKANKLLGKVTKQLGLLPSRRRYVCPNRRFPCLGRCRIMYKKCRPQLDGCDAETPNRKHCPLTACFSRCGCGRHGRKGGNAMTCHQRFRISLEPRLIGWLKSMHLDPGGRWGSILGVFLKYKMHEESFGNTGVTWKGQILGT